MQKLKLLLILLLLLLAGPVFAQPATEWAKADEVSLRLISSLNDSGKEPTLLLGLEVELQPEWHTYWRTPGAAGLAPSISWEGSSNLDKAEILWPAPTRQRMGDLQSYGYSGHFVLPILVTLQNPAQPLQIKADVSLMACHELCIPFNFPLTLGLPAGPGKASPFVSAIFEAKKRVPATTSSPALALSSITPIANGYRLTVQAEPPLRNPDVFVESESGTVFNAPVVDGNTLTITPAAGEVKAYDTELTLTLVDGTRAIEQKVQLPLASAPPGAIYLERLLKALAAAFIGGFILNFMPCVLPVLSLKLLSVASHGGSPPRHIRLSFLASAAGIIFSFLVLAVVALSFKSAGTAIGWGIQFQQPGFIIPMVAVLTLFTASLWNLIHIPLPRFIADAVTDRLPESGGPDRTLLGNFITGAFATLLATPCSAPFVGTALGFALAGSAFDLLLTALLMGTGLALPYLLVAAFPRLANRMPKPGRWMEWLKAVLGFALMVTMLWLAQLMYQQWEYKQAALVGGGALIFLFVLWIRASFKRPRVLLKGIAGMALVAAFVLGYDNLPKAPAPAAVEWTTFDEAAIPGLIAEGKVVFVDVTADWCLTCLSNKKLVLEQEPTLSLLRSADIVAMKADWTRPNPAIGEYLKKFNRYGIPFNIVYGPDAPQGLPLPELLSHEAISNALSKARCPSC